MKIKQMTRWCWEMDRLSLIIIVSVLLLVNLIGVAAQVMYGKAHFSTGNDIAFSVTSFVTGCILFPAALRYGVTHGVSRRTMFVGCLVNSLIYSVVCAFASGLLQLLMMAMPGKAVVSIFFIAYQDFAASLGDLLSSLVMMLWNLLCIFLAMVIGFFVGGVFYRLGKIGKVIWSVGLPVGAFVILPLLFSILPPSFVNWIAQMISGVIAFLGGSPYHMMVLILAASAVFLGINWILLRRAPIKAA